MTSTSFRLGDHGPAVAQIRDHLALLGLLPSEPSQRRGNQWDAVFDEEVDAAVRAFQQQRGLIADGIVGPSTWRRLEGARWALGDRVLRYGARHMQHGDDVAALQRRLHDLGFDPGRIDGIFGPDTEHGLKELQRNLGLPADGLCGPVTFRALERLSRTVVGGEPHRIREAERLHHRGPGLAGKVIVIDPGHGGDDHGVMANGLVEAEVVGDLASRIEGRLGAMGVTAFLTRGTRSDGPSATEIERATFANEVDADLVISLHTDGHNSQHAQGVATYYYGTSSGGDDDGVHSVIGEAFAELVQREIVSRTDLLDGRTDAKTWDILQRTRMPAVRIDVGYLTHAGDAARLADPALRDTIAEAVLVALQQLYQPTTDLRPTVVQLPTGVR
ncbi:MAG TPA: N-acetylmuramoyl-L-alanine amidase [Actinomycetes bacterium]|nr:N-acetylmuramoyl-L-alanine amidase [Actinomycetes bacterium]